MLIYWRVYKYIYTHNKNILILMYHGFKYMYMRVNSLNVFYL